MKNYQGIKREMKIIPDEAYCKKCKTKFDLSILRERKDYEPGICPKCGGFLFTRKEYTS